MKSVEGRELLCTKIFATFVINLKTEQIMGMIMNQFRMLQQVRDGIKRGNSYFNRFVLSAVIVHDPNDTELTETIRNNFFIWAKQTGDNFLFVTFVSPSDSWKEEYRNKEFNKFDKCMVMADSSLTQEAEDNTMPLLRDFLDLPEYGSYLMLAKDLASDDFHRIAINSSNIVEKLELITRYCDEEASGKEHSPKHFSQLKEALDADKEYVNLTIDLIAKFSALICFPDKFYWYEMAYKKQLQTVRELLSEFKNNHLFVNNDSYETVNEKYIHYAYVKSYIADKLSRMEGSQDIRNKFLGYFYEERLFHRQMHSQGMNECENLNLLNDYERKIYETYLKILAFENFDSEYATPVMCLARIIESQLHNSYCQLLRMVNGIEMPEYFDKYCRERGEVLVNNDDNHTININESQSRRGIDREPQKGVPMGNLIWAYKRRFEQNCNVYNWREFEFFKEFNNRFRNKAAHIGVITKDDFREVEECFRKFMQDYIKRLHEIKERVCDGSLLNEFNQDNLCDDDS